ncbi:MAG: MarR family transcriptional regulator [Rhodocyclaceae bacterium]|nr:MarR family transcriptional regulator [Rhodocyclaceae bacterium]
MSSRPPPRKAARNTGKSLPDGSDSLDLEGYVPYLLNQAHRGVLRAFEPALAPHGLNLAEWRVLAVLAHRGRLRVGDLALATGLEPPTLVRVLAGLESRGRVRRRPSATDRRATDVEASAAGRAAARAIVPLARRVEAEALAGLTADEAEFLRRLLRRLVPAAMQPESP